MMTIKVFGPAPDMRALAECIKFVPPDSTEVLVRAPLRNAIDRRPCQQPNWLIYDVSADNKFFINLIQKAPDAAFEVNISK